MPVRIEAAVEARHRSPAIVVALALSSVACHDAVLDLSDADGPEVSGTAGSAGADSLESPEFCGEALGDCLYRHDGLQCRGEVGETSLQATSGDRARLLLDMTNATELRVAFEVCEPRGYVLNLGDSPSNNGGGGDAGDFQHDAEILIYDVDLTASTSDLGYETRAGYHPFLLTRAQYVAPDGCSSRTLYVRDQFIADGQDLTLRTQTPTALRIDPSGDEQGSPDAYWYLGVNRVVSSALSDRFRVGTGLVAIRLCFALAPTEPPSRAGP
jgi:hypothetical protein